MSLMLLRSLQARSRRAGRGFKRRASKVFGTARPHLEFTDSGTYWERRYQIGGDSGAGSYGRLARFKAEFLNRFVAQHAVSSVIEFGSGDGAQLALADYPRYLGVDVSRTAIAHCRSIYRGRAGFEFIHTSEYQPETNADLSVSLDVIYHLVEDRAYVDYMERLFDSARRFVIIYSSNHEERPVPHVRHRQFTDWVEANRPEFRQIAFEPNRYPWDASDPENTSFADFFVYERAKTSG